MQSRPKVTECGLFAENECSYLNATQDGIGIIEVKCPKSYENLTPEGSITSGKFKLWFLNKEKEVIANKRNNFFFSRFSTRCTLRDENIVYLSFVPERVKNTQKLM